MLLRVGDLCLIQKMQIGFGVLRKVFPHSLWVRTYLACPLDLSLIYQASLKVLTLNF
jgi:hypothetical protein